MPSPQHKTLIVACGALAKEIIHLQKGLPGEGEAMDLQCLPAGYHNFPDKIVPGLKSILDERGDDYDRILIGYGDCGTGGGIDRFLEKYDKVERLPGAHCYAFFAGLSEFDDMMEEELGSFFLTDYLARHFETLIVKGFGIDRYPNLKEMYFEHYKRVVYLSQAHDDVALERAKAAAKFLELEFEHRHVGYGELASYMDKFNSGEMLNV